MKRCFFNFWPILIIAYDDNIVHINNWINVLSWGVLMEKNWTVCCTATLAKLLNNSTKAIKPAWGDCFKPYKYCSIKWVPIGSSNLALPLQIWLVWCHLNSKVSQWLTRIVWLAGKQIDASHLTLWKTLGDFLKS